MGKWKKEEICNDDMIHDILLGNLNSLLSNEPCEECNLFCYKRVKPCLKYNKHTIPEHFHKCLCDDGTFHTSYYYLDKFNNFC